VRNASPMMVNSVEIKIVKDFTGLSAKLSSDGEITVEIGHHISKASRPLFVQTC